jgi:hypothetical protein
VNYLCELFRTLEQAGHTAVEARESAEEQYVDLTNRVGNQTLYPTSENYYLGDNIPGKPRNVLFWFGGFPFYRKQCRLAFEELQGFEVG